PFRRTRAGQATRKPMLSLRKSGGYLLRRAARHWWPLLFPEPPPRTRRAPPPRPGRVAAPRPPAAVAGAQPGAHPHAMRRYAPLPHVAGDVEQPEAVSRVAADLRGLFEVRPRPGRAVGVAAVEVRLLRRQPVTERERRRRPGPAGVLPLRLRRQPVRLAPLLL